MKNKPATIKEIARKLGISPSSVSRGLHDHPGIGLTTRMRIKKLAEELNYQPNQTAIFLQKGKTYTVGVILPELSPFFSAAISGIEDTTNKKNYHVLMALSHDDAKKEKLLVEKMKSHRVDGLIISLSKETSDVDYFNELGKRNIPVVFFDRIPPLDHVHSVSCNIETGTIEAVTYLLKKGHRTIGMINGPSALMASSQRREGYIKSHTKNRLKYDPKLIVSSDLTEEGTRKAMNELLNSKRKPSAIVTFNDYVSLYAIKYAREQKLRINEDLEFVSYANLPLINYMEHVPTASVEQYPYVQGQKATDILLDLLNNPNNQQQAFYKVIIDSKLIERAAHKI